MAKEIVKVGFVKLGNIGMSRIVDLLLDERADREDVDVRVLGTGAKMTEKEAEDTKMLLEWDPDLVIVISPNAAIPGPKKARMIVKEKGKHCIVISDNPARKAIKELEENDFGYIIITGDPLIGARREFLDPTEMSLFNADVLRVLTICGATRLVQEEIDGVISEIKNGKEVKLPRIVADADRVVERAGFSNPYAKAKAIAAYNMAEKVAEMNVSACFVIKEPEKYIMVASAAHEMMREAAVLADEAHEIEKYGNAVLRRPHSRKGEILEKTELMREMKTKS